MKYNKLILIFFIVLSVLFVGVIPACLPDSKGHSVGLKYLNKIKSDRVIEDYCEDKGVFINELYFTATNGVFFSSGIIHLDLYLSKGMPSYVNLENYCKEQKVALGIKRKIKFTCYIGHPENGVLQYQNTF